MCVTTCLHVQVHGEMLYQVDHPAGSSLRTPDGRRGSPATPRRGGGAGGDSTDVRQRLAAFRQWLRLLLFQLLTLAVQVGQLQAAAWRRLMAGPGRHHGPEDPAAALAHIHVSA